MGFKSGFVFVYMGSVNLYHLYVHDIYFFYFTAWLSIFKTTRFITIEQKYCHFFLSYIGKKNCIYAYVRFNNHI